MAYVEQYTANFTNEQGQDVVVSILQKDGTAPITVENYPIVSLNISANSDSQDSYACIISKELSMTLWATDSDSITWETFITSTHDEWKVIVTVDGVTFFIGFLSPDEGSAPFQDKPYEVNLKATDGLGLLKGYEFKYIDGTRVTDFNTLIEYISSALYYTGLQLPIRAYCGYFHTAMQNKADGLEFDFFQHAVMAARSVVKSYESYENCYDVLKMILDGWCSIEQYEGRWQIVTLSERQYIPGSRYYVDYDYDGTNPVGAIDSETVAEVGKDELIYPINESQFISCNYANKQVKTIFEYKSPEVFLINQGFRFVGSLVSTFPTYEIYNLDGWSQVDGDLTTQASYPESNHGIYVRLDAFGSEESRDMLVYYNSSASGTLKSCVVNSNNDFYVAEEDEIEFFFEWQSGSNPVIPYDTAQIALLRDGQSGSLASDWWTLGYTTDGTGNNYPEWFNDDSHYFIGPDNTSSTLTGVWRELTVTKTKIPENGIIYVRLGGHTDSVAWILWRPVQITYTPKIAKTKRIAKGERYTNGLNNNNPDVYENKIGVDGNSRRGLRGCLYLKNDGTVHKSNFDKHFYRYPNTTEDKLFKNLVNLGKFNQSYRRFYKIEGDFTSLFYTDTLGTIRRPLGFHKAYRFTDITPNRDFVLIPSLEMDLITGNCKCVFVEVYKDSADGTTNGDVDKFDYIF